MCELITDNAETAENEKLINYVLNNSARQDDGRVVMPLMWNKEVVHLLSQNFHLAKQILMSSLRKLKKDPEQLKMVDSVVKDQLDNEIIAKVGDLDFFL